MLWGRGALIEQPGREIASMTAWPPMPRLMTLEGGERNAAYLSAQRHMPREREGVGANGGVRRMKGPSLSVGAG